MGIRGFESRLEKAVEGTVSRIFRGAVKPVEFARKLQREMDSHRSVGVDGNTIAPNHYAFWVSEADYSQLADILQTLSRELADTARRHARDEGYRFVGPVEVTVEADAGVRQGVLSVEGRFIESADARMPGSLMLPTGDRVPLGEYTVSIGRQHDCTVVLADPNVSRRHAEVAPSGTGFAVTDLGSTNGTVVNGSRITGTKQLTDGDEVRFGNTVMHFEAS
ncbi:MAG: FHA domain-containing protein [Microthrixaceae bacterium]|nr:FHA domain-containing protein [Microthrixaceae bacterium]MCO5319088.1 FHA domain-containing protein [Microthrixaceae bacterium]